MTGYTSKKAASNAKLEQAKEILLQYPQKDIEWQREQQIKAHAKLNDDDDDIQVYQRPWVYLTDEHIKEIVGPWGDTPIKGYTRKLIDQIEAKLRENNNG